MKLPVLRLKHLVGGLLVLGLAGAAFVAMPHVKEALKPAGEAGERNGEPQSSARLASSDPPTLALPPSVIDAMDIKTVRVEACRFPRNLPTMVGSLGYDTNRLY